jgi:hypothetical protein
MSRFVSQEGFCAFVFHISIVWRCCKNATCRKNVTCGFQIRVDKRHLLGPTVIVRLYKADITGSFRAFCSTIIICLLEE